MKLFLNLFSMSLRIVGSNSLEKATGSDPSAPVPNMALNADFHFPNFSQLFPNTWMHPLHIMYFSWFSTSSDLEMACVGWNPLEQGIPTPDLLRHRCFSEIRWKKFFCFMTSWLLWRKKYCNRYERNYYHVIHMFTYILCLTEHHWTLSMWISSRFFLSVIVFPSFCFSFQ